MTSYVWKFNISKILALDQIPLAYSTGASRFLVRSILGISGVGVEIGSGPGGLEHKLIVRLKERDWFFVRASVGDEGTIKDAENAGLWGNGDKSIFSWQGDEDGITGVVGNAANIS
jgi:hypothetical protein